MNNSRNKIFTIKHRNKLFRANNRNSTIKARASNAYSGAPMKYFTLNEGELSAYTKYGKPYKKTWHAIEDLTLIDILNKNTRRILVAQLPDIVESLDIAFPIIGNKVMRRSNEDTRVHDDNVLRGICSIKNNSGQPMYDGYYMKSISGDNEPSFHSEVGLCAHALSKLELNSSKKNTVPPPPPKKKRRPANAEN
jgi:hypothetical protein